MQPIYQVYKDKELQKRGIPLNTILTPDNCQILLTKDALRSIANRISQETNKKFTTPEIEQLINFITRLPTTKFHGKNISEAYENISNAYIDRYIVKKNLIERNIPTSIIELTKLNEISEDPSINDYQRKEINQFTKDENPYKYAMFANRRGDAVVDQDRVDGKRSSPDGLPSGRKLSPEEIDKANYKALKMVQNFLNPDSINDLIGRISSCYTNFSSINLPHQTIPLDSRNRLVTNTSLTEYTWNIHTAGQPGHLGDIRIQDTLQQVVKIDIGSFWLPMYPVVGSYYNRIRLLIKEFSSQSNIVTEFLNPNQTEPTVYYYHFEFNIISISGNKVFLEPVNRSYIFRKPFARVETLTISFRTPFELLPFTPDRGLYTLTFGNPTLFTITSEAAHLLATGDLVYVINSDPTSNEIANNINRQIGWFITVISPTQFTIPYDSSAAGGSETNIEIYYGSKRVFLPIEFTSLEQ